MRPSNTIISLSSTPEYSNVERKTSYLTGVLKLELADWQDNHQ